MEGAGRPVDLEQARKRRRLISKDRWTARIHDASAIEDDDPVLFFEHKYLYRRVKEELPQGDHIVPIGKARLAREGRDLSIVTYAATVWKALEAAEEVLRAAEASGERLRANNPLSVLDVIDVEDDALGGPGGGGAVAELLSEVRPRHRRS